MRHVGNADAAQEGQEQENYLGEYPQGNCSRQATETGGRDRTEYGQRWQEA